MSAKDRELLSRFTAVPHKRHGNERVWSVTGESLNLGQIVHMHAMCGAVAAIRAAIKQDIAELWKRHVATKAANEQG